MDLIFIETPEFVNKVDKLASISDLQMLEEELIKNPYKGNIVKGAGGARKIRMKIGGKGGKRSGGRVVYYYVDLLGEIWFLDLFLKSDQKDLSDSDKKKFYKFIKEKIHGTFK